MDLVDPLKAWEKLGQFIYSLGSHRVSSDKALGRVLAEEIVCPGEIPAEDRALRDGYAIGTPGDKELLFEVLGESAAGLPWKRVLTQGGAVGVRTGAVVPQGTFGIVPMEEVQESGDKSWIRLKKGLPAQGSHILRQGQLFRAGSKLLGPGQRLGPAELSLLASVGVERLRVRRRPKVVILPTGSELEVPGAGLGSGKSFVSHGRYLAWRIEEEGGLGKVWTPIADLEEEIWMAIDKALGRAHLIVTTGGTGPSDRDLVCRSLLSSGAQVIFRHLPVRPGGTISAFVVRSTPVLALPGGAGGVGLGCELLLIPAIRTMQGEDEPGPRWLKCRSAVEIQKDPLCHRFVEATLRVKEGLLIADPVPRNLQGGGLIPLRGDGWIHVPPGENIIPKGAVAFMLLGKCIRRPRHGSGESLESLES